MSTVDDDDEFKCMETNRGVVDIHKENLYTATSEDHLLDRL